ncbi:Odorant receptor 28 [Cephus cinctus]|uniref:Odorant receptor n=1 Tax=Cephus cinctus TaxID=211228 RepID=A0A3L9LU20_CEPCN|nr:odorant receptor 13a isoform X1 [Cephus cinctus]RLZ02232.1 Odorant receptor 28 [Cephus cinctus]
MASHANKYLSIKLVRFFMKLVGIWVPKDNNEQWIMNCALSYTILVILLAVAIEGFDIYYCWGNFYATTYTACATMPVIIVLAKIFFLLLRRKLVMELIEFTETKFWQGDYDSYGMSVLDDIDRKGVLLMCTFIFFVQGTVIGYVLTPIIENIGKNESDRVLPVTLWINIPVTTTPYFEICFVMESLTIVHIGICFFCFDIFLCILNIHAAGQFKMLQHRFALVYDGDNKQEMPITDKLHFMKDSEEIYIKFKDCVKHHKILIDYTEKVQSVFTFIILCQILISSLMMTMAGFQALLTHGSIIRRLIFIAHTSGCFAQLLLFTSTCHEIIIESGGIADAAYNANWANTPYDDVGRSLRIGLQLVMIRASRPCHLSAGGFCHVSLDTFTAVLSTAASYFTLLRQIGAETVMDT